MAATQQNPDFIVVGAGPSGAALASRLAEYLPQKTVLLLEAGTYSSTGNDSRTDGENESGQERGAGEGKKGGDKKLALFDRYSAFRTPGLNYGYQSTPQAGLDGAVVDYSRGKGLGGTSLINFLLYNRGPRDDWTRLSNILSLPSLSWPAISSTFSAIESFAHPSFPPSDPRAQYIATAANDHGTSGPLAVGFQEEWEDFVEPLMRGVREFGWKVNGDLNSGDPIGVGLCPATARGGWRVGAQEAYLRGGRANLEVRTGWGVGRVLVEGGRVVGVEELKGEKIFANNEVILSAGALDSPKILLLSGIGPAAHLESFGVPVLKDLPGVGQNLQDHCHFPVSMTLKDSVRKPNNLKPGSDALAAARAQLAKDGTGPLSSVNGNYIMGFLKEEAVYASPEFAALDEPTQAHLLKPTVPTWEFSTGLPVLGPPRPGPPRQYLNSLAVLMNPQSRGSVTLQSADPVIPALFNPNLLTHPYDRRVLITAAKRILAFHVTPSIAATIETPYSAPVNAAGELSEDDDDILAFLKKSVKSTWHMSGTCKMGIEGDEGAVVDTRFKVKGVEGLRVVDLSVLPLLVNAHPVATAYALGEIAARVLESQYAV